MNFAICLDPNSPGFNLGNLSSNGFSVYGNLDNFTTPIAQNIPASNLLPPPNGTCPFILNVPTGTTQIIVIDQCTGAIDTAAIFNPVDIAAGTLSTNCCYSIIDLPEPPIPPITFCEECGIGFDIFDTSTIGKIIAGNVTSSCGPVTDYTIGWYKDGDYSAPEIISGYGTIFSYPFGPHPLTGNNSPLVLAGNYEGIIHDIIINGTTYSSVSGSANGIAIPFESCFETVVVDPLDCNNGTSSGKYSHQFTFNSQAVGATSAPVSVTYTLNPTTQHFAYVIQSFSAWDEIEIKWISGDPSTTSNPSLYSQPIYLEKLQIGSDVSIPNFANNTLPYFPILSSGFTPSSTPIVIDNVWPKKSKEWGYFQRVLTLTSLETSSNPSLPDFLEITITPNPTNNNTQWVAGFQCLDTFDCSDCFFDDYPNSLPKIWKIELDKLYGCDKQKILLHVSGCKPYETSDWAGKQLNAGGMTLSNPNINLINATHELAGTSYHDVPWAGGGNYFNLTPNISCTPGSIPSNTTCAPSSNTTITLNKTPQQIQLTFNSQTDYLHYKNALLNAFTPLGINSPVPCNTNLIGVLPYYRYFKLFIPYQSPNANCGDNTTQLLYFFHINDYFNINYVENPGSNFWSITIPQSPMVNCSTPPSQCDSCFSSINSFISSYNANINNPVVFSFSTNTGAKYINPIGGEKITRSATGGLSGSYCNISRGSTVTIPFYSITTIPFIPSPNSPTGWVNLTTLTSSLPCSLNLCPIVYNGYYTGGEYQGKYDLYQVRFPHLTSSFNYSLSTNDFEIYALSNFGTTGSTHYTLGVWPYPCPETSGSLIYSYIGGVATMYSSSFFWQGNNPTLIIDP